MITKRIVGILQVLSLFLLIDLATNAQAATYSFKILDVPGATGTSAYSINASGQVAGDYNDAAGTHGFVYSGGKYTSLDVPGATSTSATSINARGQVAGNYDDATGATHGFVYSSGKYTFLNVPGATSTSANRINARGQVAGNYDDATGATHGFVYSGGKYTSLNAPGATNTAASDINASGQVAGYSWFKPAEYISIYRGFVYRGGNFTFLDVPGAKRTLAYSINDSGQVAGNYNNVQYDDTPYKPLDGFVHRNGNFTFLPAAKGGYQDFPISINASGQVAGYSRGNPEGPSYWYGFVYSDGKYTFLDVPGAAITYANTHAYSINDSGQVAGSYVDASSGGRILRGFVGYPIPTSKEDCMNGGWKNFGFKNQRQCIQFVNTGK